MVNKKKTKNESIQKKEKSKKKFHSIFFYFLFLPPENPPEDRNSGIRSFTGPDRPGSVSKTTRRTGFSISKPAKRPGQPEMNFTGFLHTLVNCNTFAKMISPNCIKLDCFHYLELFVTTKQIYIPATYHSVF